MTTFANKVIKRKFESNVVVKVGTQYFSQRQPDSGLSIPAAHIGLVLDASITPTSLEITNAKTSVSSMTFSLLDKDAIITDYIIQENDAWINREVYIYIGTVNCSCSFSSYKLLKIAKIKSYSKVANAYNFTTYDPTSDLIKPIYTTFSTLSEDLTIDGTTISLIDTTDYPSSGTVVIDDEFITYTGKTDTTLTGGGRGAESSEAETHSEGAECYLVYSKEDHSMDILLDVLLNEVGLDSDMVISSMFEDIRDNQLSTDGDFKFELYNIENALTWIEQEILLPTNTRFVIIDGAIGLTILDENTFNTSTITESDIRGTPSYTVDGNRIINKVYVKYDYAYGTGNFLTTSVYENQDSIDLYGEKPFTFEFKGILTDNGGATITSNRATRLLGKLAFPIASLSIDSHFSKYSIYPSEIILVNHRYLPARGKGLGMSDIVEVTSVGIKSLKADPHISLKCEYTSFGVYRLGLISPSPTISTITSQSVFDVPDGTQYEAGYVLNLWDIDNEVIIEEEAVIDSINGNEITLTADFTTVLVADKFKLIFANYDSCSDEQKETYAFISPDTNEFADGLGAYRITF